MNEAEYWGSTDMVFQCLIDKKRTVFFGDVISNAVKEGDVVVDLGAGSGILSLYAAKAGASKIYAIEAGKDIHRSLQMTIDSNNLEDKIILIKGDATNIKLPEKVDVVLCEMIATCLLDELQIPAISNILNYCKADTKIIPETMNNYIDLVDSDEDFYGHKIKAVQYEYGYCDDSGRRNPIQKSNKYMYKSLNFTRPILDTHIKQEVNLVIKSEGIINGLRFSNTSGFPDGSLLGETPAYCMPLIIPLNEVQVSEGDVFKVNIEYEMCKGLNNLTFSVDKKD